MLTLRVRLLCMSYLHVAEESEREASAEQGSTGFPMYLWVEKRSGSDEYGS